VEEAGEHLEGGRFAGAVRAEEADDLARGEVEGDAVDRLDLFFFAADEARQGRPDAPPRLETT
jgi:hypothetical protein